MALFFGVLIISQRVKRGGGRGQIARLLHLHSQLIAAGRRTVLGFGAALQTFVQHSGLLVQPLFLQLSSLLHRKSKKLFMGLFTVHAFQKRNGRFPVSLFQKRLRLQKGNLLQHAPAVLIAAQRCKSLHGGCIIARFPRSKRQLIMAELNFAFGILIAVQCGIGDEGGVIVACLQLCLGHPIAAQLDFGFGILVAVQRFISRNRGFILAFFQIAFRQLVAKDAKLLLRVLVIHNLAQHAFRLSAVAGRQRRHGQLIAALVHAALRIAVVRNLPKKLPCAGKIALLKQRFGTGIHAGLHLAFTVEIAGNLLKQLLRLLIVALRLDLLGNLIDAVVGFGLSVGIIACQLVPLPCIGVVFLLHGIFRHGIVGLLDQFGRILVFAEDFQRADGGFILAFVHLRLCNLIGAVAGALVSS